MAITKEFEQHAHQASTTEFEQKKSKTNAGDGDDCAPSSVPVPSLQNSASTNKEESSDLAKEGGPHCDGTGTRVKNETKVEDSRHDEEVNSNAEPEQSKNPTMSNQGDVNDEDGTIGACAEPSAGTTAAVRVPHGEYAVYNQNLVLEYLSNHPTEEFSLADIHEALEGNFAGVGNKSAVYRACRKLVKEGRITRRKDGGKHVYKALPRDDDKQ